MDIESVISWDDLKSQLNSYAVAHEITRISSTAKTLQSLLESTSLGLKEILNFSSLAFYSFCKDDFKLQSEYTLNTSASFKNLILPLGFLDGQYGDAIFLNRHIIADPILEDDPFVTIGIKKYACFPIVSQLHRGEQKQCHNKKCPCHYNSSSLWWAEALGNNYPGDLDEDSRRQLILQCPEFKCNGLLWVDLSDRSTITSEEVTAIVNILTNTALVWENFEIQDALQLSNTKLQNANETLKQTQKKADHELVKAQEIQKGLLPRVFPAHQLKDKAHYYSSADRIGGDYFDCFPLDDALGIVVADVSGHGVSAGLFMSMFKVLLKAYANPTSDPFDVLTKINKSFLEDTNAEHFVTVFFGIFTPKTRELRFSNAGHVPIFLSNIQNTISLESNGIFVGGVEDMHGGSQSIRLPEDTRLLLYTDGISESTNPQNEQWGEDTLLDLLKKYRTLSCKKMIKQILADNKTYRQGSKIHDDITLFCLDL